MARRFIISLFFLLVSFSGFADEVVLNPNHPKQYVVVKGDTLWDISAKFLKFPWYWPDIWHVNPQIENPHLIYPGDVISLVYRDGKPSLELTRGVKTYKLSPKVREVLTDEAISTLPLDVIRPFLNHPLVVGEEVLDKAPYIVASSEGRLISSSDDNIYVRGVKEAEGKNYSVFKAGTVYKDPKTAEVLGYEAIYSGEGVVTKFGDPSTIKLTNSTREILVGDRLLPTVDENYEANFFPRSPVNMPSGQIISIFDGVSQIGQYQVVIVNRGQREGLEEGDVLSIYQAGDNIKDSILSKNKEVDKAELSVKLPDEYAGIAMVFKVFDKVSYALVMKAIRAIHINDTVSAPQ